MHISKKWLVWNALSFAFFLSFFHRIAPAVITDHLMKEFSVGATAVGGLASIYFYVYMAMQIPTGALADSLGPRITVAVGSAVAALGSLVFALAPTLETAFLGRFLVGLGVSVAFICTLKAQALWFEPYEFATMAGVLTIVGTIGSIAAATPLAAFSNTFGWRNAFVVSAILSAVSALLIWGIVCDHPSQSAKSNVSQLAFRKAIPIVWKNRQTWFCCLMHFGWFGCYLTFTGLWGVPYLMHVYGFDRIAAANWMIVVAIAYTIGAFLHGRLSDHWLRRRKPPLVIAGVIFLAMWLTIILWPGHPPTAVTILAFTVASIAASANVIAFAVVKESNPPTASGLAMATANGGILCAGILQPLMGYFLDMSWDGKMVAGAPVYSASSYELSFIVFIVVGFAAFLSAMFVKETYCRDISDNSA